MNRIAGVILAGGLGSRLGGDKPLQKLHGRPLIDHVIERAAPQVAKLWLSTCGNADRLSGLGLEIVEDEPGRDCGGPLAGIVASLAVAEQDGFESMATFPCDAPFIPRDLVAKLNAELTDHDVPGAIVMSHQGLQPTFGLWRTTARSRLNRALMAGKLKLQTLCRELGVAVLDCRGGEFSEAAFFNINTLDDLTTAAEIAPPTEMAS